MHLITYPRHGARVDPRLPLVLPAPAVRAPLQPPGHRHSCAHGVRPRAGRAVQPRHGRRPKHARRSPHAGSCTRHAETGFWVVRPPRARTEGRFSRARKKKKLSRLLVVLLLWSSQHLSLPLSSRSLRLSGEATPVRGCWEWLLGATVLGFCSPVFCFLLMFASFLFLLEQAVLLVPLLWPQWFFIIIF